MRTRRHVTICLDEYYREYPGQAPRGRGGWMFRGTDGAEITRCGTYTDAVKALPEGIWMLLP